MDETKICPFCAETIRVEAVVCKHCGRDLEPQPEPQPEPPPARTSNAGIMWPAILCILAACPLAIAERITLAIVIACVGLAVIAYALATGRLKFLG